MKRDYDDIVKLLQDLQNDIKATDKIIVSIRNEIERKRELRRMTKINNPTSFERYMKEYKDSIDVLERTLTRNNQNMKSMLVERDQLLKDMATYLSDMEHLKRMAASTSKLPPRPPAQAAATKPHPTPRPPSSTPPAKNKRRGRKGTKN